MRAVTSSSCILRGTKTPSSSLAAAATNPPPLLQILHRRRRHRRRRHRRCPGLPLRRALPRPVRVPNAADTPWLLASFHGRGDSNGLSTQLVLGNSSRASTAPGGPLPGALDHCLLAGLDTNTVIQVHDSVLPPRRRRLPLLVPCSEASLLPTALHWCVTPGPPLAADLITTPSARPQGHVNHVCELLLTVTFHCFARLLASQVTQ